MQDAIIAIEDARFRDHGGVDPIGLVRAAVSDYLGNGSEVQGASTLTQQYIKNLYLEQAVYKGDKAAQEAAVARDANRKILEIRAAIDLEKTLTKDQILERYLNIAYFGNGAYGIEAAAETYFSVPAAKLTVEQSAMLAGIVQSPDTYDPFRHKTPALNRRNVVLDRMHELKLLGDAPWAKAKASKIVLKRKAQVSGCIGAIQGLGFFCQYVRNLIASGSDAFSALGSTRAERVNALDRGGLTIQTSVDLKVQAAAQKAIQNYLRIGDKSRAGTAAVTVEPGTGHVLAMAENKTYNPGGQREQHRDQLCGRRPARRRHRLPDRVDVQGVHAGDWLKDGKSLNDVIDADVGTVDNPDFTGCDGNRLGHAGDPYKPQNSEPTEGGKMSVLDATANSVNTAFVAMEQQLELCQIAATANSLGVHLRVGAELRLRPDDADGHPELHQVDDPRPVLDRPADDGDGLRDVRGRRHLLPRVPGVVDQGLGEERDPDQGAQLPSERHRPRRRARCDVRAQARHHERHRHRHRRQDHSSGGR